MRYENGLREENQIMNQIMASPTDRLTNSISTREVFRLMIANELRAGRLTRSTADKLFRFASDYGVSRADAEAMFEQSWQAVHDACGVPNSDIKTIIPGQRRSIAALLMAFASVALMCLAFNWVWSRIIG